MSQLLYLSIAWPVIVFVRVAEFIIWEIFSDGRWKRRELPSNSTQIWIGNSIEASRQIRELEHKLRLQNEELEKRKK